jgi:hypothetical protein
MAATPSTLMKQRRKKQPCLCGRFKWKESDSMYKPMEQIEKEYDGQWVFLINCTENERGTLLGGEVVLHSENRSKVVRNMSAADNGNSLTFIGYVGRVPEGVAFL